MAGAVCLVITAGPLRGRQFRFTSHDTFVFGRATDCHARLAASDVSASRHHFLLEVNPPRARVRDLGSLNGTNVNGVRHGGRRAQEAANADAARPGAGDVELQNGDEIRVGATVIRVEIAKPAALSAAPPAAHGDGARIGGTIGPYTLDRLLGRGGMGAVYLARPAGDGPPVALKLMLPEASVDEAAQEMFLREIEVTRALRHANIVGLLDFGKHEGRFYFVLEYCARGSTEALRADCGGRVPLPLVLRLACDALAGLAFAHEKGFVHRDIKPDNVLLTETGVARLADFGLAKSFQQAGLSGMTATGAVAGTFFFMPREQLTSFRQVRPVSDVWSMAATLYFLLTGQYVRDFSPQSDPLAVVLRGGVVPLRRRDPNVPGALAEVVDRALADDPDERYPTGGELAQALRAVL